MADAAAQQGSEDEVDLEAAAQAAVEVAGLAVLCSGWLPCGTPRAHASSLCYEGVQRLFRARWQRRVATQGALSAPLRCS